MKKIIGIVFILAIALYLIPKQSLLAATISISSTKETIYVGESIDLSISGSKKSVSWNSSNSKIAKVDKNGTVTGVKKGTVKITATCDSKKVSCIITVKNVTLSKKNLELKIGDNYTLKLKGSKTTSYISQNNKIVTVSKKGVVTAVGAGKTTISVKAENGKTYKCTITVPDPNKDELPEAYKKLIKFIKKSGVESNGSYCWLYDLSTYNFMFMIEYNPDKETITFSSDWENGTIITMIIIDLNDIATAEVMQGYFFTDVVFAGSGYIELATFKGEPVPVNIEGTLVGCTKKELQKNLGSGINTILINLEEVLSVQGVTLSDLGFKKY